MPAQSPEPEAHDKVLDNSRSNWNLKMLVFEDRGKPEDLEKNLRAEKRTNNKLNPHMTPGPGIEPKTHWWEASTFLNAPQGLILYLIDRVMTSDECRLLCVISTQTNPHMNPLVPTIIRTCVFALVLLFPNCPFVWNLLFSIFYFSERLFYE